VTGRSSQLANFTEVVTLELKGTIVPAAVKMCSTATKARLVSLLCDVYGLPKRGVSALWAYVAPPRASTRTPGLPVGQLPPCYRLGSYVPAAALIRAFATAENCYQRHTEEFDESDKCPGTAMFCMWAEQVKFGLIRAVRARARVPPVT
jgi:hypothetical protein